MRSTYPKTKIIKLWLFSVLAALLFSASVLAPMAQAIARGYSTDDTGLQTGMIVVQSANSGDSSKIERADRDNSQQVIGVVTTIDNSLVTVASGNSKVLVESEGQVDAYVSDINGEPKKGDLLT